MHQVTFQYVEEDLRALYRFYPWYRTWAPLLWVGAFVLLALVLGSILPLVLGYYTIVLVCWAVVAAIVLYVVVMVIVKRPQVDLSIARPTTLRLEEEFWSAESELGRERRAWSAMGRVGETNDYVLIEVERLNAFPINRRAFASPAAADAFAEFARQKKSNSAQSVEGPLPPWPLREADLIHAHSDPELISVRHKPTIQELVNFDLYGVNPPQKSFISWVAWVGAVGVLAAMMALLDPAAGKFMGCVAVALLSCLVSTQLYGVVRRWQAVAAYRRRPPGETLTVYSPRGISRCTFDEESFVAWRSFSHFTQSENFLVLHRGENAGEQSAFPLDAFASDADRAAFIAYVEQNVNPRAAEDPPAPEIERTPETGNPYQPPRQDA